MGESEAQFSADVREQLWKGESMWRSTISQRSSGRFWPLPVRLTLGALCHNEFRGTGTRSQVLDALNYHSPGPNLEVVPIVLRGSASHLHCRATLGYEDEKTMRPVNVRDFNLYHKTYNDLREEFPEKIPVLVDDELSLAEMLGAVGPAGDAQADLTVHGGLDKAVYFYPRGHYPLWERILKSSDLPPGSLGENITSEGISGAKLYVGDVLRIGTVTLQVLQPRSPCYKLQLKFGRVDMVAQFVRLGLPGWYASVLQPGQFSAGDPIEVIPKAPERITISEIWRYSLASDPDAETLDRIMHLNLLPQF